MKQPFTHRLFVLMTVFCFLLMQACSEKPWSTETGYYVSDSGNDKNPGTQERPFKTIDKINSLELLPGDVVFFKGGDVFEGTLTLTANGTAEKPVVIGSYGGGIAVIDGKDKEAVILRGSHFTLRDLYAKGSGRKTGNTTNGVSLIEASYATVDSIRAEGFQKSGLDLYNCHDVIVKKVQAINNGFGGINVGGADRTKSKNIRIEDSHAENNAGDPTNLDNHSGNGILVGWSDNVVIDHCTATNNGWDMPRIGNGPVGIWAYETNNITIQYCISYRNKTAKGAKDGGGFDLDGGITNSVIQYCLSYENEGAGYGLFQYAGASLWHNNIIRYCVSLNDATSTEGSGGIFVWNGSDDNTQLADCFIHNNLVYTTHAPAISFEPSSLNKNFLFGNNIFLGMGEIVKGPASGEKFTGNIWWHEGGKIKFRDYESLEAWTRATAQETLDGKIVGRQIDPLLAGALTTNLTDPYQLYSLDGLKLHSTSPLKNSGLNVYELFNIPMPSTDFYGTPLAKDGVPEPGIYEWAE